MEIDQSGGCINAKLTLYNTLCKRYKDGPGFQTLQAGATEGLW